MSVQALSFVWEHCATSAALRRGETPPTVHERAVLLCLANYADKDGWNSYPKMPTIADETGVGESTARDICQRLWAQGRVDGERRPAGEIGGKGFYIRFRVVMDPDAITRKAAARQRLSPYEPDGLDDGGHPLAAPAGPHVDETAGGDPRAEARPSDPPAASVDNTAGAGSNAPAASALDPPNALDARQERAGCAPAASAPIGNREPGTGNRPSSSSPSDSRRDAPAPVDDDDQVEERVAAAVTLLAEDDLAQRLAAARSGRCDDVADELAWRDHARTRRLEDHGADLRRLAGARPDAGPDELVELLSIATGADLAPASTDRPTTRPTRLEDGTLVLPGSGALRPPDPPPTPAGEDERRAVLADVAHWRDANPVLRRRPPTDPAGTAGPTPREA